MARTPQVPAVPGPPDDDPLPGTVLGGYRIDRAVASGGMGIVYSAIHQVLKRKAAVKVLRPEFARNEEQIERFLKEAQAISSIHHRGIIHVQDFGKLPDGRQYMVMEFLEGETLEEVLRKEAPMPVNRALSIVDEVLDALSAAHKVGVVHRDLKPSNVFMTLQSNGTAYAKLVDFGLAKQSVFSGEEVQAFAKASVLAGTPEYISPEQARGLVATPRTDLYCLGVMVFEMLSGGLPFAGNSLMEFLQAHVNQLAPRVSSYVPVPEALDELVASLLEKNPDARPRSADVVRQAIARILKDLKESSTQQISRPMARPEFAGAVPMEDTAVRGSDPGMAKQIKEVRERASGPKSVNGLPRKSSKPSLPRLPGAAAKSSSRKSLPPVRAKVDRATGETDQALAPIASDASDDGPPTERKADLAAVVKAVVAAPPPPKKFPVVPVAVVGVLMLVGGSLAAVALVQARQPAVPRPTTIEEIKPETAPEKVAAKPAKVLTEAEQKEIDARLSLALKQEQAAAALVKQRDFKGGFRNLNLQAGVEKKDEKKKTDEIGRLFENEVKERGEVREAREKELTAEQRARDEIRKAKVKKDCAPTWKGTAKAQIDKAYLTKKQNLDPDAPDPVGALKSLDDDAKGLRDLVVVAKTTEDCLAALETIEKWVPTTPILKSGPR